MKILYGVSLTQAIDVTDICTSKLNYNNVIIIPNGDGHRALYFTDPYLGILKKIIVLMNDMEYTFEDTKQVFIDLTANSITYNDFSKCTSTNNETFVNDKLAQLHAKLQITHGRFSEEVPEQKMAVRYLTGTEKVLEIGGNVGRNSLIIASLLQNSSNLVTLECDDNIASKLIENRDLNGLQFHVENSALSNRKLIQQGWNTFPSDVLWSGYSWVPTITLPELVSKYNITFDTLVLDCEGAFYYILMDMPEILNGINLIIMENDYHDLSHKMYIDGVLIKNNFRRDYVERGGWGPCESVFFEVWKR